MLRLEPQLIVNIVYLDISIRHSRPTAPWSVAPRKIDPFSLVAPKPTMTRPIAQHII